MSDGIPEAGLPDYERMVERAYRAVLRRGDCAIDIGAHSGRHTLPMAQAVGAGGRIVAFEPLADPRDWLRSRLAEAAATEPGASTASVEIRGEALSDRDGRSSFVAVRDFPEYSGLRRRAYDAEVETAEIEVETRRLDGFLDRLPRVSLIKLDAEGAEYLILRGARGLLRRDRPVVCFECGDNSLVSYEHTAADMAALLVDERYGILSIRGEELDPAAFVASSAAQHLWDYVAVPSERPDLVRAVQTALSVAL